MQLVSPALPVGAYAYSQGQEYAVDSGWLKQQGSVSSWIEGLLKYSLGRLELPVLQRVFVAWQNNDLVAINRWNHFIRANRETSELLLEDEQLGLALKRLLCSLGVEGAEWELEAAPSFVILFALAGERWQIPISDLSQGFAWSWLENQVAAATKLVPLGQTQAQQLLSELLERIPDVCEAATALADAELGIGLPALAIASSRHERQYSRLFRS